MERNLVRIVDGYCCSFKGSRFKRDMSYKGYVIFDENSCTTTVGLSIVAVSSISENGKAGGWCKESFL